MKGDTFERAPLYEATINLKSNEQNNREDNKLYNHNIINWERVNWILILFRHIIIYILKLEF